MPKPCWSGPSTPLVSFIGIVLTIFLGTLLGIARLSSNWLVSRLAAIYIEVFRIFPSAAAFFLVCLFLRNAARRRARPSTFSPACFCATAGLNLRYARRAPGLGMDGMGLYGRLHRGLSDAPLGPIRRLFKTGQDLSNFPGGRAMLMGLPAITWCWGAPVAMDVPQLKGFNFRAASASAPNLPPCLLGLVLYTAAFVAEVVRAGIQSVSKGQTEAAMSMGLQPGQVLNLVILPQALRVIIPAPDQPDAEPDQKQFPGGGHRLSRFRFGGRHHHQSDRPGHRGGRLDHGGLSVLQPAPLRLS
jgi:general L-amino acid transport system permease protein